MVIGNNMPFAQNIVLAIRRIGFALLTGVALSVVHIGGTAAQGFSVTITVNESGNGRFTNTVGFDQPLTSALLPDPGPGGLAAALTYNLLNPPDLIAGDLVLRELVGGPISDIIRFNPNQNGGSLVFYSDFFDGGDRLADTGFPSAFYTNIFTALEIGSEGNNGFTYTPVAGQPGFVAGAAGLVTYVIQSDVRTVDEPSSLALLSIVGVAFGLNRRRRMKA
jgi:hypothetical protein